MVIRCVVNCYVNLEMNVEHRWRLNRDGHSLVRHVMVVTVISEGEFCRQHRTRLQDFRRDASNTLINLYNILHGWPSAVAAR